MNRLISCNMTIEREEEIEVDVEGWVEYEIDRDYGADIDGNRGCVKVIITEIKDVIAFDYAGNDIFLTSIELEMAEDLIGTKFLEIFGV